MLGCLVSHTLVYLQCLNMNIIQPCTLQQEGINSLGVAIEQIAIMNMCAGCAPASMKDGNTCRCL